MTFARVVALVLAGLTLAMPAGAQQKASSASGAFLRGLDKVNGHVSDLEVGTGGFVEFGRLEIALGDCRYPSGNPAGDAFAYLTIREAGRAEPVFQGWMIASSPALNAMEHPRYDVWVMRCKTE